MDSVDLKYLLRHAGELLLPAKPPAVKPAGENDQWFYFLHIPKTAGTSFRYTLYEQFDAREVYPNSVDYYLRHRGRYLPFEQLQHCKDRLFPSSRTMLIGHYRLAPLDPVFRTPVPKTICFLRDPVERMLSSINYKRARGRPYHGLSLDESITRHGLLEGQLQASIFGYNPRRKNIHQVLENMERIDALGIVEQYERSIRLINTEFDWNLQNRFRRNQASSKGEDSSSKLDRSALAALCEPDMEVYEYGLKLFQARCE